MRLSTPSDIDPIPSHFGCPIDRTSREYIASLRLSCRGLYICNLPPRPASYAALLCTSSSLPSPRNLPPLLSLFLRMEIVEGASVRSTH
jgi:hypothetical protein